jgi:hypothetical protein
VVTWSISGAMVQQGITSHETSGVITKPEKVYPKSCSQLADFLREVQNHSLLTGREWEKIQLLVELVISNTWN